MAASRKGRLTGHVRKSQNPTHEKKPWIADYFDQYGKRHQPRFAKKGDADKFLVKALGDVQKGTHTPRHGSPTIAEVAQLYLDDWCAVINDLDHATLKSYRYRIRKHVLPMCGHMRLADFSQEAALACQTQLLRQPISRRWAKDIWQDVCRILDYAINQLKKLEVNVARRIGPINMKQRHKRKLVVGEDIPLAEEARAILAYVEQHEGPRWRALIAMLGMTGMRIGELRGLTWDAIDFEKREIRVSQRANSLNEIGMPKSFSGQRIVPVPAYAAAALKHWRLGCPRRFGEGALLGTTRSSAWETARYLLFYPRHQIARSRPHFGFLLARSRRSVRRLGCLPRKINIGDGTRCRHYHRTPQSPTCLTNKSAGSG